MSTNMIVTVPSGGIGTRSRSRLDRSRPSATSESWRHSSDVLRVLSRGPHLSASLCTLRSMRWTWRSTLGSNVGRPWRPHSSSGPPAGAGSPRSQVWDWRSQLAGSRAGLEAPRAPLAPRSSAPRRGESSLGALSGLERTVTPPMIGKARTRMRGEPGSTGTSASLMCLPPMMASPVSSTSMPSGTVISIPPMIATAVTAISSKSISARRKSISQPPMTATAATSRPGRHRPRAIPGLITPTIQRRNRRRRVSGGAAGSPAVATPAAGAPDGRSTSRASSSPLVLAARATPTRSANSSRVREPSVVCWRRRSATRERSSSETRMADSPPVPSMDIDSVWLRRSRPVTMYRPAPVPQRRHPAGRAGAQGDDLGADGDGRLLRGAGPDVEAYGPHHPGQLVLGEARLQQPSAALGVGAARAHGPQVAHPGAHGRGDGGDVELGVVGEHAHRVAGPQRRPHRLQVTIRPVHHHLVGHREALRRGEDRAGVADRDPVAEDLGHPGQGGGEVHRPEDDHLGRGSEHLHEHSHLAATGLAVAAVVAGVVLARLQGAQGVAGDHGVEAAVAQGARPRLARPDEDPRPQHRHGLAGHGGLLPLRLGGHLDDAGQGHRLLGAYGSAEGLVLAHQSRGSTKRWMVPPQVSPTANASSSE